MSDDTFDLAAKREEISMDGEPLFSENRKAVSVGPVSLYVCLSQNARAALDLEQGDPLNIQIYPDRLVIRPGDDEADEQ